MNLSPAYLKWRKDTLEEGRQEEQREIARDGGKFTANRFGSLDEVLVGM